MNEHLTRNNPWIDTKTFTISELCIYSKLCKSTIYKLIRLGQFPSQVHLSTRRVFWLKEDIDKWIIDKWIIARKSGNKQG